MTLDISVGPELGQWKAVIAFGPEGLGTAILACSPGLAEDLRENGSDPDDCFLPELGLGVFMWEGCLRVVHHPGTPNGPEEWDAWYEGSLRELTEGEWALLRRGDDPITGDRWSPPLNTP